MHVNLVVIINDCTIEPDELRRRKRRCFNCFNFEIGVMGDHCTRAIPRNLKFCPSYIEGNPRKSLRYIELLEKMEIDTNKGKGRKYGVWGRVLKFFGLIWW